MSVTFTVIIFVYNLFSICCSDDSIFHQSYYDFPDTIPIFNVRKDRYTALEVSRGKLNELGIIKLYDRLLFTELAYENSSWWMIDG